jgi:hypothetical protein
MTKSKKRSVKRTLVKRRHTNKQKYTKRNYKKHKSNIKSITTPIFDKPKLTISNSNNIFSYDKNKNNSGNIIPGLRDHL